MQFAAWAFVFKTLAFSRLCSIPIFSERHFRTHENDDRTSLPDGCLLSNYFLLRVLTKLAIVAMLKEATIKVRL